MQCFTLSSRHCSKISSAALLSAVAHVVLLSSCCNMSAHQYMRTQRSEEELACMISHQA